jgi:leucyl-tRNA synthetase
MQNIAPEKLISNSKHNKANMNLSEVRMWIVLKSLDQNFRRQHILGNYVLDFVSLRKKLIVEVDGISHESKNKYDATRDAFIVSQGFKILKFIGAVPYPTQSTTNFVNNKISELLAINFKVLEVKI